VAAEGGKSVRLKVPVPAELVREVRSVGLSLSSALRRALIVFAARQLPPGEPPSSGEAVRIDVSIPREAYEYVRSLGGVGRAAWFYTKVLRGYIKKMREIASMPDTEAAELEPAPSGGGGAW